MAQSLIACPLCSAATFSSTNALCLSLVSVASKWLRCTLCEEELHGLDKLTIHLLSHLINTTNYKKCLTLDNTVTPDLKLVSGTEPLNLVKNHNNPLNDSSNKTSDIGAIESFSFQPKVTGNIINERPSLKIDDEVMIVFNCNDNSVQNKNTQLITNSNKPYQVPSTTGIPKLSVNFSQSVDKYNDGASASGKANVLLSDGYFNLSSTNEEPNFLFSTSSTNSNPYMVCSSKLLDNDTEMDLSLSEKMKGTESEPLETNNAPGSPKNAPNECSDQNMTGNKSTFLSPSGERVLGYRCDVCSLVFPDEQILLMHRKLIHTELSEDPSKAKKYKCHLCSKSFIMKGSLMVHMRVAHFGGAVVTRLVEAKQLESNAVSPESAQYICSICNKGFTKEQQLTQHEKLHDGKQCDICLKTFTTKYFLRKHKRLHTGEMPYSCNVCNKSFTFQQSYHKHLLYHSDDKPYSCAECGRAFKELSTLHNHQRIHTGEKPFSCETCGKCFRQRVSYLVHRRIHTGVMPYKCQSCGKTFRYKVSERTHKCVVSALGSSNGVNNLTVPDAMQEIVAPNLTVENNESQSNSEGNGVEKQWHQKQAHEEQHQMSEEGHMMNDTYPEPTDFFSLVMSPSDRLQHLSLSADSADESNPQTGVCQHNSIDTEALKQLLYDAVDYNN